MEWRAEAVTNTPTEPAWLTEARRHIGLREIPGAKHNSVIIGWLESLRAWWKDDETPWCGTFVAHCMQVAGQPLPKFWMRAKDWLNWGVSIPAPLVGCVVVFEREGGGHVGLIVGKDARGNLMVLGGNQGNALSIAAFDPKRVAGYRWPDKKTPMLASLPIMAGTGKLSTNEA